MIFLKFTINCALTIKSYGWACLFEQSQFYIIQLVHYKSQMDKAKLLKKYAGEVRTKRQRQRTDGLLLRDNEISLNQSISSEEESVSNQKKRKRVRSDSEGQVEQKPLIQIQEGKKSKRINKGIRKALGLRRGEDADQFLEAVKIEGVDMNQLENYLKNNKAGFTIQSKQDKKLKKQSIKEEQRNSNVKLQNKDDEEEKQSQSSDLVIPEQSRTIYRNKDGTIRQFSEAKAKQIKKQQVLKRLGEWQKGMKEQQIGESQPQQIVDIWDDPARRWESAIVRPFRCAYQGYANRFGIKPGFRWDGVVRGNGFQTSYLQQINLKKAREQQSHKQYLKNL